MKIPAAILVCLSLMVSLREEAAIHVAPTGMDTNAVDLDGYQRIKQYYGNIVDIGAYEYIPALTAYEVH